MLMVNNKTILESEIPSESQTGVWDPRESGIPGNESQTRIPGNEFQTDPWDPGIPHGIHESVRSQQGMNPRPESGMIWIPWGAMGGNWIKLENRNENRRLRDLVKTDDLGMTDYGRRTLHDAVPIYKCWLVRAAGRPCWCWSLCCRQNNRLLCKLLTWLLVRREAKKLFTKVFSPSKGRSVNIHGFSYNRIYGL